MKLTISKVHRLMGQVLGGEAVTLQNFITRVQEDGISCGVVLGADGVLYYDPDWWNENIDTPEKARHAIFFEIMKNVLGVPHRQDSWYSRVAVGAVINSYLYNVFGYHELPRAMYSAKNLPECLMRPNARGFHSRLKRVYRGIWQREERFTSIANVEHALRVLFGDPNLIPDDVDPEETDVPGYARGAAMAQGQGGGEGQAGQSRGHGNEDAGQLDIQQAEKNHSDRMPSNVLEHMSNGVQSASQAAGYSEVVNDEVVKRMKSRKSLETILIEDFVLDNIKKKIRKHFEPAEPEQTMLPLKLNKRDAFKLAMGWMPLWYENNDTEIEREDGEGGLAIYMDVSGSFHSFIPYTLGVIQCVEDMVEKVFQFSNVVAEIPFEDIKGDNVRIKSTGGTDFDCIIAHAIENNYDKVMIITDGWADVNNPKLREQAEQKIKKVLVTLVTSLPGQKPYYVRGNEMTGEYEGDPFHMENERVKKHFLESTWIGQQYGFVVMLSEAFKHATEDS